MHLPFNDARYSPDASSNINSFFFVADVKCGLYEINKNNRVNATHGPSQVQSKNVPRPNQSAVVSERSRTRTWTCTKMLLKGNWYILGGNTKAQY